MQYLTKLMKKLYCLKIIIPSKRSPRLKIYLKSSELFIALLIRLIPQGTVYNNVGQDRQAGPKALDPNYWRQSTL